MLNKTIASILLGAFIYIHTTVAISRPNLEACPPPPSSKNTTVTILFGGRAVIITCGNTTQRMALCMEGSWTSSVSCSDDASLEDQNQMPPMFPARSKRNTGKYHELKRHVKVQRKLRAGLLETSIDESTPTIYRAHPRGTVYLACRVENLGAHSVTWIRARDSRILAIDSHVIDADRRITAKYEEKTETWFLGIQGARKSDEGRYICKISTKVPLQRTLTLQIFPADQPLHGPIRLEDHDLNFVLRNLTSLWEEVNDIRQEIVHHLHEGHKEDNHDEIMKEVETLHHEHHVHHLHHPHEGHNLHHSADLLKHLEEAHGHLDEHTDGQPVHGHLHGHGPSHDHFHGSETARHHGSGEDDSHESGEDHDHHHHDGHDHHDDHDDHDAHADHDHDEHTGHRIMHDHQDEHDSHGLHMHEDEHEYGHEHEHDHASDDVDSHGHHDHDDHTAGDRHGDHGSFGAPRPGAASLPGSLRSGRHSSDPWMHASCTLKPNKDDPTSNVRGSVIISKRKDGKGPAFFDIHLTGIDVANNGRIHGFHVHEQAVTDEKCGTTGGHFNPTSEQHGAPEDEVRHVGDLGNIEVDENGELHGHIIEDERVSFNGASSIISKSIVVHAGEDDLGLGGDEGSLTTGNAGGRLACCTIYVGASLGQSDLVTFRMKG